jgi:nucleoside-diphosphate-sugar epimerase
MKVLIIGGNRFVGLRLARELSLDRSIDLHILNRTGQAPHAKDATVYKGDRNSLQTTFLDRDWDVIVDFACFNDKEAKTSLDYFQSVKRYIFVSTVAVYQEAKLCSETDFDSTTFDLAKPPSGKSSDSYADGKRRAEAAFTQAQKFPMVLVRLPYIVGPDDYTERLAFYVHRIEDGENLHVPNPTAKISLIRSEDAFLFLKWCLKQNFTGPINVASPQPISLRELIGVVEMEVGKKWIQSQQGSTENTPPYLELADHHLNTSLCERLGFASAPWQKWLPALVDQLRLSFSASDPSTLH